MQFTCTYYFSPIFGIDNWIKKIQLAWFRLLWKGCWFSFLPFNEFKAFWQCIFAMHFCNPKPLKANFTYFKCEDLRTANVRKFDLKYKFILTIIFYLCRILKSSLSFRLKGDSSDSEQAKQITLSRSFGTQSNLLIFVDIRVRFLVHRNDKLDVTNKKRII